jgi:hypothetical protein
LSAEVEACLQQVRDSENDLKNIVYRETHPLECITTIEIRQATDLDLVRCMQSLQKLVEDCEMLRTDPKGLNVTLIQT